MYDASDYFGVDDRFKEEYSPSPSVMQPPSPTPSEVFHPPLPLPPQPSELTFIYTAQRMYFQNPKKVIPSQVLTLLGEQNKAIIPNVNYNMGKPTSNTNPKYQSKKNSYYMAYPLSTKLVLGPTKPPSETLYVYSDLCPCQGYPIYSNLYKSFTVTENGNKYSVKFQ